MAARPFHTFTATGTNGDKLTYNIDELPEGTTIYVIPQEGTPYEYRLQRDIDNNLAWFAYRDGKTVNPHHGNSGKPSSATPSNALDTSPSSQQQQVRSKKRTPQATGAAT